MSNKFHKMIEFLKPEERDFSDVDNNRNLPVLILDNIEKPDQLCLVKDVIKEYGMNLPFNDFVIQENYTCEVSGKIETGYVFWRFYHENDKLVLDIFIYLESLSVSVFCLKNLKIKIFDNAAVINGEEGVWINENYNNYAGKEVLTNVVHNSTVYLNSLILKMYTRGYDQERVKVSEKLNKNRVAKGKPRISDTIYIKPLYYYDKDGVKHSIGKTVTPHRRAGHYKTVRYGKGREKLKQMYIKPTLVNFKNSDGNDSKHKIRVYK